MSGPLVLSAPDAAALAARAVALRSRYEGSRYEGSSYDEGRQAEADGAGAERAVILAHGPDRLAGLAALAEGRPDPVVVRGRADVERRPVLVFSGAGAQRPGMCRDLLESDAAFRAAAGEAVDLFGGGIADALAGRPGAPDMDRPETHLPALFTVQIGLAAMWRRCTEPPAAVIGHSIGEIAAAYVTGALTLEEAAEVTRTMGAAVAELTGSTAMLSVFAPPEKIADLLTDGVELAAVNGPKVVVVAGPEAAVTDLALHLRELRIAGKRMPGEYGVHWSGVEKIREPLEDLRFPRRTPKLPLYSATAGGLLTEDGLADRHWFRCLRDRVRFTDVLRSVTGTEALAFVEVSPAPVVTFGMQQALPEEIPVIGAPEDTASGFVRGLAEAHVAGIEVDWTAAPAGADPQPPSNQVPSNQVPSNQVPSNQVPSNQEPSNQVPPPNRGPSSQAPSNPQPGDILALVLAELAAVTGHPGADPDDSFNVCGLTSAGAVRLSSRLSTATGRRLTAAALFEHPTPAALAAHLRETPDSAVPALRRQDGAGEAGIGNEFELLLREIGTGVE